MAILDTDQLRTFLAVEKTLSFTQAADRVAKTQSAVSMQIKKLEETVGKQLFHRLGRTIELTREGHELVPFARDILETSNRAIAALDDEALSGSVRLGITDDYCERFLPAIMGEFSRSNPLVEVEVHCGPTSQIRALVEAGKIDAALVTHNEAGDTSQLVRKEPLFWVTGARKSPHQETPIPLAFGARGCTWRQQAEKLLQDQKTPYRVAYTSTSVTVTISAVIAGLTVSVFPESALRPGMRVLNEEDGFPPLEPCEIGILRGIEDSTPITEALIEHILSSLDNLQPREFVLDEDFWNGHSQRSVSDIVGGPMIARKTKRQRPGRLAPR